MADLKALIALRKRLQSSDPEAYKKRLMPYFQEALTAAHDLYVETLMSQSVSNFDDTVASGSLLRAFETRANKVVRASASRLYFTLALRSRPPTSEQGDPASYYEKLDSDTGGGWDTPTVKRIMRWLKQRNPGMMRAGDKIQIPGRNGKFRTIEVRALAVIIVNRIKAKMARGGYKPLHLTPQLITATGIQDPNSPLRKAVRGLALAP